MSDSILIASGDAGNGGTNVALFNGKSIKTHYEPSVRAMATGDSLGLGNMEMDYTYVDWYGNRYVTGDDVIKVTRRGLERHMGSARYGEEFHRFLVATSLAKMGVREGEIDLILFAPPGLYKEAKQQIEENFLANNGQVRIKLKGDKKPREWCYRSVTVYPEGIGGAACFLLDDSGQPVDTEIFDGESVLLDSGAYTLDALRFSYGNFNPESLSTATWENAGIHTHIREPLLRKIHQMGDDYTVITIDDVDRVIRQGLQSGDYNLKIAGQEMDLKPLCEKLFTRYADWISNNICDGVFNSFKGIRSVMLIGGGELMIAQQLIDLYPGKILDRRKYPHVKKVHPVDMNAVGGLRLKLAQLARS